MDHDEKGPGISNTEVEAVNSGLAELLGDSELTTEDMDTVGTPAYWAHEEEVGAARRMLGEQRL